ncbi:MAG TPA: M20 family metallopeptidase [Acidimicrobiales bacterium]|jgi:hippurate hydrolase
MTVHDDAVAMAGDLVELRRTLHRHPEIGLNLPMTQERVLGALDGLPLEITTGRSLTSVVGVLRGGRPGPTVLLRGDMDALPVTEQVDVDYRSEDDATMHACGHDLHTTMLVGAAELLSARREELTGDVVFMFQPGEEGWDGAGYMIEEGVLDVAGERPAAAYAIHVASSMWPRGMFVTRPGPMMAASDGLTVRVKGAGGHGSAPHRANDPVPAACEMVLALQTMLTRRIDAFDVAVITVGSFHAGTKANVIPEDATFDATIRTFDSAVRDRIRSSAVRMCEGIAAAHGLEVDANYKTEYPLTVNDGTEAAFAGEVAAELFGADRFAEMERPLTGSEDFSRVIEAVPGAMLFLGATPPDRDPSVAPNNHSPHAAFDDAVLADGAALYAELALRRMARG